MSTVEKSPGSAMSRGRKLHGPREARPGLWGGLALSCASIVFCLLVGEAVVRFLDPLTSSRPFLFNLATGHRTQNPVNSPVMRYDATLGHEPVGGAAGTLMGQPVSFSADGMRNHNLPAPPAGEPPILAVGDSFTEGWAVKDDDAWPAYLARDTGRRVLNAGVRGYGLDQMVLRAERLAPRFKPQAIILAFIEDDMNRAGLAARHAVHKPYFRPSGDGLELHNVPVPTTPVSGPLDPARRILGYSYLLDFIMRQLGGYDLWYGDSIKTDVDTNLLSCRLMQRFAALAKREEAQGVVVAFRNDLTGVDTREAARLRWRITAVLACARDAGLTALDTHDGFAAAGADRESGAFYFDRHFTARGNALAAKLIASTLEGARVPVEGLTEKQGVGKQ
ncbi:SGNH/GDSL hydrolase family protein [Reyranella sp.]|uniref:SGNH/GDSL hydrolase family protein n=1 Tax=Reyranella sp. TaxID=1929291 RepID=UPI0025EA7301|nr:SGNH/GDSL hydrolase family protein [Reyranella sp.]